MDIELGSRFRLFQTGRATLSPSYFLCVFWDEGNGMTRPCLAQTIGDALGPIVLELTEMGSPNYEDAEVELYAGDWQLTVYEQTSSTNYDPALSGREVWSELVRVNVPDTPQAPRQPYNGPIVPDANRVCIVPCVYGTPTDGQVITWDASENKYKPQTPGSGPSGSGDVTGPASAVNNNFASFNLTTGKVIKDSGSNAASFDPAGAASAAQTAAIAASQPLDAYLTAYANAANAAARRALIGAGTGNGDVTGGGTASGTNTGDQDLSGLMVKANNLSDLASVATARANLDLWTTVMKTVSVPRTSTTTLVADPYLKFPMAANTHYELRLVAHMDTVAAADFKFRTRGPASPTLIRTFILTYTGAASPVGAVRIESAYSATDITMLSAGAQTGGYIRIEMTIHNGPNAGDFEFLWAQNTSYAGNTSVLDGSYLEWHPV